MYIKIDRTVERRETVHETLTVSIENDYVQVYKNIFAYMKDQPCRCTLFLIFLLSKAMDGGRLPSIGSLLVDYINEAAGKKRSFYENLKLLVEAQVLLRPQRGYYLLNPAIAWKGNIAGRKPALHALISGGQTRLLFPHEPLRLGKVQEI
jgi:hypothetical protein